MNKNIKTAKRVATRASIKTARFCVAMVGMVLLASEAASEFVEEKLK